MRTAIHGMVTPGNPKLAAELAVRDGIISHSNSGLLGGVFNAVLVSLAYVEKDMKKLTEMTVDTLPKTSEYYEVASRALRDCKESTSWQEAWEKSSYILEEYNWVHVYPNVICEIIALWFGENDFDKTAAIITTLGLDSDCNAAPILNAMGIAYGMDIINNKWTEPLGEEIKTILRRYREINLNDLCNVTTKSITDAQNSVQTKNILLICTAGITSGVLVKSIDNYVREHNLNYNISSVSIGEARKEILRNDIILLSPQTGYLEKNIQEIISGKGIVKVIPGELYAWMDVESIIEIIK